MDLPTYRFMTVFCSVHNIANHPLIFIRYLAIQKSKKITEENL